MQCRPKLSRVVWIESRWKAAIDETETSSFDNQLPRSRLGKRLSVCSYGNRPYLFIYLCFSRLFDLWTESFVGLRDSIFFCIPFPFRIRDRLGTRQPHRG